MPRPYPPSPLPDIEVRPFHLDDGDRRSIARTLGLQALTPQTAVAVTEAISIYKATAGGSKDTTVGNTLAALAELNKQGCAYQHAVERLADDRSGVDYTTLSSLRPLATAVLNGVPDAREALAQAARTRTDELQRHPRVDPAVEAFRFFCGVLRLIFSSAAASSFRRTDEECWRHCRRFAMEVFAIAGITDVDFDSHPDRLKQYLGTDVTT